MFRNAKLLVAGLSLTTMVFAAPSMVRADDAPAQKPAKRDGARGDRTKMMEDQLAQLNLTADQKAKIDPIITKLRDDVKKIMDDTTIEQKDKREKVGEAMKTAMTDIKAVLTPDQQAQLEKMQKERRGARGDRGAKKKGGDKPAN
jgi:Spy/CpxP family protein refolding chaperone